MARTWRLRLGRALLLRARLCLRAAAGRLPAAGLCRARLQSRLLFPLTDPRQAGGERQAREHVDEVGLPLDPDLGQDRAELRAQRRDPDAGLGGDLAEPL